MTFEQVQAAIEQADECYVSVSINYGPDCIVPVDKPTLLAALDERLARAVEQRGSNITCLGQYHAGLRQFILGRPHVDDLT